MSQVPGAPPSLVHLHERNYTYGPLLLSFEQRIFPTTSRPFLYTIRDLSTDKWIWTTEGASTVEKALAQAMKAAQSEIKRREFVANRAVAS